MANWCKYCTGSYPFYCSLSGERISNDYYCKNDGYKCPIYEKYAPYYVTCTTCTILNKENNDKVFDSIRTLKDKFMVNDENYSGQLTMYDMIGPLLSVKMVQDKERKETATKVYSVLEKISVFVDEGKIEDAFNNYSKMVGILINKYGLNDLFEKKSKKVKNIAKTLD